MTVEDRTTRLAGFLYLIVVLSGFFSLVYVPSQISSSADPQTTIANITQSESLFRLGIASFLVNQVTFLLLPLVLFRLLRPVGETAATLMVVLAVVSVPIGLASLSARLDALNLLSDAHYATALGPQQLQAHVLLALDHYRNGILITMLFWGLWLFPFGYLVFKSGFLPKILGVLLMLGCLGYLIDVFGKLLAPGYPDSVLADFVRKPAALGEIGTCLWLLCVGARRLGGPDAHQARRSRSPTTGQ
jgi:hypothetical protein